MRLKKIELFGFKSFYQRTEVEFDGGVTCVVGPNGCGKSNISDAVRWVLGERSAKMLRGSKMEDVIFAGTAFRKPLAMAEVSLTIDNSDRGLPIEYKDVTISRRLYRSGESEYLINRTICRLKDVHDLIADTGIGSNHYSMIEQGRIDYILNADPGERRFLIEEAAGISKYKAKKEEAIRKLTRTEENLLRLKDIVNEVGRNIQYAERQAMRARKYKEQFEKLKDLETRMAFYELSQLGTQRQRFLGEEGRKRSALEELIGHVNGARESEAALDAAIEEIRESIRNEEARGYELRSKIEQNEQTLRFHQENQLELASRQGGIAQEVAQIEKNLELRSSEIAQKGKEHGSLDGTRAEAQAQLETAKSEDAVLNERLRRAKEALDENRMGAMQAAAETARIRTAYHRLLAQMESGQHDKKRQEAGVSRFQDDMQTWTEKQLKCEETIAELAEQFRLLEAEKGVRAQQLGEFCARDRSLDAQIRSLEGSLQEERARMRVLEEIDVVSGVHPDAVIHEMAEQEKIFIKGLRDIVTAKPGFEWALEASLGDFARSYVVDDIDSAEKLISRLQEKRPLPVGVIIRDSVNWGMDEALTQVAEIPGVIGRLTDVVDIHEGYATFLTPLLSKSLVVESITEANLRALLPYSQKYTFITREGTVLGQGGQIYVRDGQLNSENSYFKRGTEIETLRSDITQRDLELESLRELQRDVVGRVESLTREVAAQETDRIDLAIRKESYESVRDGMKDRRGSFQRELDLIFMETQEVDARQESAMMEKSRLEIELVHAEEAERVFQRGQGDYLRDLETYERKKAEAYARFSECRARLGQLDERGLFIAEAIEILEGEVERDKERINSLKDENERNARRTEELQREDEQVRVSLTELREAINESDVQLRSVMQDRQEKEAELAVKQSEREGLQGQVQEIQDVLHEMEMKAMDVAYQEKAVAERIQQAYHIDLHGLSAVDYPWPEGDEGQAAVETIEALRGKVESLGTVNLLAIDEYDELKTRYDFLLGQQKDLEDARVQLLETIKKINRTTKSLFEETFQRVQETFKEYYEILFGGGEARLILVDESNPLESGIDIVAKPPAKRLQHISLLSGGEKAMTALALLFALFKIKPSPFCVLDEVDAPLDEANIDRFLAVLRTFLDTTQFIIVTHNRKTIAMGDSLYGVTMEEAGVSKVVSVRVGSPDEDRLTEQIGGLKPQEKVLLEEEEVTA
ncbi:MAG: chromosome segregation protein SMC [Candidatus Omnitrophota bacterium]|nr:chromosome segregation protein SMC [Candidatus Omnitrophota bacterium]